MEGKQQKSATPPVANTPVAAAPAPKKSKKWLWVIIVIVIFLLPVSIYQSYRTYYADSAKKDPILPSEAEITGQSSSATSAEAPTKTSSSAVKKSSSKSSTQQASSVPAAPATTTPAPASSSPSYQTTFTKQEQIDFFVRVALKSDSDPNRVDPVIKWTKTPVLVKAEGAGNAADYACVDETISLINGISNTVKLSRTSGTADTVVHFVTKAQIEAAGHSSYGYMDFAYVSPSNLSLKSTNAYIAYDRNEDNYRCRTIRHEMTHTLGLFTNAGKTTGGYDYSVFNVNGGSTAYLEIDKDAIRIMYNTAVAPGWTETQVRNYLAGASW